jgi:hypothetical protein
MDVGASARPLRPAAQISGYLGNNDKLDEAIADFSIANADQNESDHEILVKAVSGGPLKMIREGP